MPGLLVSRSIGCLSNFLALIVFLIPCDQLFSGLHLFLLSTYPD